MAKKSNKKKNQDPRLEFVDLYKQFVYTHGACPANLKEFMSFGDFAFGDFKAVFDSLEALEVATMLLYFKRANDAVLADEHSAALSPKERHLTFCYVLVELVGEDEIFLQQFLQDKKQDGSYVKQFLHVLNKQSFEVLRSDGRFSEQFEKLKINPKKSALTNHALGMIYFYLRDKSADKQDTDAFIEKSTDLLFRLTDTSTLMSMFDLGKFMASRKETVFSWD